MVQKKVMREALVAVLGQTVETLRAAHADAVAGATHAEAKPENDKDTRALEQSYLARGQAERLETALAGLAAVRTMSVAPWPPRVPIGVGALVEVEDEAGESRVYLVAPDGGGLTLPGPVLVVTPQSPVGQALSGKYVDDTVELGRSGRLIELTVRQVR